MIEDKELLKQIKNKITKIKYYWDIRNEMDRETAINNVFIKLWERLKGGNISSNWNDIEDYVFISCRNECISQLKQQSKQKKYIELDGYVKPVYIKETEETVIGDFLDTISNPLEQDIIRLKIIGYTEPEICETLLIRRWRIQRALKKIRYKKKRTWYIVNDGKNTLYFKSQTEIAKHFNTSKQRISQIFLEGSRIGGYTIEKI